MARTAALNVALSAAPGAFAAPGLAPHSTSFERVVADLRLAPSRAFAATMAEQGTRVSTIDGDLTSLWFADFATHFAAGGGPIVGLTTARTALVMTELARGPGVRVLWRAEHERQPDGSLRHEIEGSAAVVASAEGLGQARDWVAGLAAVVAELADDRAWQAPMARAVVRAPRAGESLEETLSSWVLLPRRAARNGLATANTENREKAP